MEACLHTLWQKTVKKLNYNNKMFVCVLKCSPVINFSFELTISICEICSNIQTNMVILALSIQGRKGQY